MNSKITVSLLLVLAACTPYGVLAAPQRNSIDDMIIQALEDFRAQMVEGWPDQGIPPLDPLDLGSHNVSLSVNDTSIDASVAGVVVNGLASFNIDLVHTNLLFFKADVALGIPLLDGSGSYSMTGQTGVIPIFGEGPFKLEARNVTLTAMVKLGSTDGIFGVKKLELDLDATSIYINFEGIMGGGEMGDTVNGILNSMAPAFLQSLEDKYMPMLEEAIRQEINKILAGGNNGKQVKDDSVNDYFDLVFANIRLNIIENGHDPSPLPVDKDNFTITLFNQSMEGVVEAGPGKLSGLSTLHRTGDMSMHYIGEQDDVVWQGEVGLVDLQVDYRLALTLPLLGKDLSFSAKMSFVHLSFETDVFLHQSNITLAYCNVTEFGPVHFKEKGTGPLDTSLYNLLANALLGELQGAVATAVEGVVCALLEGALGSSG